MIPGTMKRRRSVAKARQRWLYEMLWHAGNRDTHERRRTPEDFTNDTDQRGDTYEVKCRDGIPHFTLLKPTPISGLARQWARWLNDDPELTATCGPHYVRHLDRNGNLLDERVP